MVAKISTGGNMFGALAYNQNKVDSEEAKVLFSNRMLLSEDGNFSIGECMRSFEMHGSPAQRYSTAGENGRSMTWEILFRMILRQT